jgi:hypothetical protein
VLDFGLPKGLKGDPGPEGPEGPEGVSITRVHKINTEGLIDTYQIDYSDNTHSSFEVTNGEKGDTGKGIINTSFSSSNNLIDTYKINYTDGTFDTFTVTNGKDGISSWSDLKDIPSFSTLINLGSTTEVNILTNNPRPGITGILPIENGGTGVSSSTEAWVALGGGSIGKKSSLSADDITSGIFSEDRIPQLNTSKIKPGTLTGDYTITGTLILNNTTDAAGNKNNNPALIIGGNTNATHVEIDGNKIVAKSNATTPSVLYINSDGGGIKIGGGSLITKITYQTTDLNINSTLATGNIVLVYEG